MSFFVGGVAPRRILGLLGRRYRICIYIYIYICIYMHINIHTCIYRYGIPCVVPMPFCVGGVAPRRILGFLGRHLLLRLGQRVNQPIHDGAHLK